MRKRSIFKYKSYSHFDTKKNYKPFINYIKNPKNIEKHGFYPFIHYILRQYKYDNKTKDSKTKSRDINFSSHIDRYIYEYYNDLLNSKYNNYAIRTGINKCVVAYRNNLHKNNIFIARDVFNFIRKGTGYYILVADFTKYFDQICHKYLKSVLSEVLEYDKLPLDWYKVFRSVTKYSFINLDDIKKYRGLSLKELRKSKRIASTNELHELKKYLKINNNGYGIPQGSPISSTLANVNLIHYDKAINDFLTSKKGFYRRYCDDILLAVPPEYKEELLSLFININISIPGLEINPDKIQDFFYKNNSIFDNNGNKKKLKYLGFEFDGKYVKVREKTITSFFLKAYRSLNYVNVISARFKRNAYRRKFFNSFTHLGNQKPKRNKGNFLTYIDQCAKIMAENGIKRQVSRHWDYFSKRLIKYNHK